MSHPLGAVPPNTCSVTVPHPKHPARPPRVSPDERPPHPPEPILSVHQTSPLPLVGPRHLRPTPHADVHPEWCDPRRCVTSRHGGIHVGTPIYRHSTVADVEFGMSLYQDVGEPEAYLLTLRRVATAGPIELTVSDEDLDGLIAIRDRLRNDRAARSEAAAEVDASGDDSGAHAINAG